MEDDREKLRKCLDDEGLLSGFLDGELDAVEIQRVCALTDPSERVEAEAQRCALRGSIKAFIKAERSQGLIDSRDLNWSCWEAIESQLAPYRSGYSAKFKDRLSTRLRIGRVRKSTTGRVGKDFAAGASQIAFAKGGRRFVDGLFRPQVAGTVFACSVGLLALSLWENQGIWENEGIQSQLGDVALVPGANGVVAVSTDSGLAASGISESGTILARENSNTTPRPAELVPGVAELLASRSLTDSSSGSADVAESWRDSGADTPQPMSSFVTADGRSPRLHSPFGQERNFGSEGIVSFVGQGGFGGKSVPFERRLSLFQSRDARGLRVGTADIEWIRSRSHIEIVPARNKNRPPVIWVGENLQ